MSDVISLKKAEQKVYTTATHDGLTDVFIGCIFLMWTIAPFLSESLGDFWSAAVFLPFYALVMLGIWLLRKYVVKPRIGTVRFGAVRKTRLKKFNVLMFAVNIIAFLLGLWLFFNSETLSGTAISLMFGMLCLFFLSATAYFMDCPRLYIYGLLVGISPPVGEWLFSRGLASHHGFPITFGIAASIMILTGLVIFIRLMKNNPVLVEAEISEEA